MRLWKKQQPLLDEAKLHLKNCGLPTFFRDRRAELFEESEKLRNFAMLTLRSSEPEGRYTPAGAFWCRTRMALGQGKDQRGNWKPTLWLTVKAFTKDGDETLPQMLNCLEKGERVTVSGRLAYEVYEDKANVSLIVSKIEGDNAEEAVAEDEMEGEPA